MKVKIYGAGSIGNHLAQASRRMGWSVDICDIDRDALVRTKNDIYPSRYGGWDEEIGLYHTSEIPISGYDMIIIGTPPDSHMKLALSAVREGAKIVLVEKPLSAPDLHGAQELFDEANKSGCYVFVGYDHAISKSALMIYESLLDKSYGSIETLDVEFREFWGGIFKAHPWLDGPSDSYLGFWKKGGGACGEHSHAINLFQNFAEKSNIGRVVEVSAFMNYVENDELSYDSNCLMSFLTEKNIIGRVVQDVLTQPTRKWARIQCKEGFLEWHCGSKPGVDSVIRGRNNGKHYTDEVVKTRMDDFYEEMQHIMLAINDDDVYKKSPISLKKGLETMLVIAAAHLSSKNKCIVSIDYNNGYTLDSLSFLPKGVNHEQI